MLQELTGKGILSQDGYGRWTRYYLPSVPSSVHKSSDSVHKGEISDTQWEFLRKIAYVSKRNKRLSPKEMEKIILKLCENYWLTRIQLANLLGRNPDGLRSRYLTQMVNHKLLQLRHPDKPNRVDQAYSIGKEIKN